MAMAKKLYWRLLMKTTFALVALSLSFVTTSFASESITFTMKTHETLTLKKVSKVRFEKISDNAVGSASLDYISGTQVKNLYYQDIDESDNSSPLTFEVKGKNLLKVEDSKERINKEVQADIKRSLFARNIKRIKIDSNTMQVLYADSMKKSGLSVLKKLRVLGGGALTSSLIFSDMNCNADGDLLVCEQDSTLLIGIGN